VGVGVGFAGFMMLVIRTEGRQFFGPFQEVLFYSRLFVIDEHRGGDVHGGNEDQAFLDAGLFNNIPDLAGDITDLFLLFGIHPEVIGKGFHDKVDFTPLLV